MPTIEERLADLGHVLPAISVPVAKYVPAVRSGNLVFTSGQLPFRDGALMARGKVGADIDVDLASKLACCCALNGLAAIRSITQDLGSIARIVKVVGFIASTDDFVDHPLVLNGASELLGAVFGESGAHARSAIGVATLPLGAPVEVELVVEVNSAR